MSTNNEQQNSNVADAQPKKTRHGAPDGPRKECRAYYDGSTPLEYPGHETVAQYLASPKSEREFESDIDIAKYFEVDRMTIYRWKKDADVQKRAHWLSAQNKMAGDLVARREFESIVEVAVEMAKHGSVPAMRLCRELAFPEEQSGIRSLSLQEVLEKAEITHVRNGELMTPTWLKEREKRLAERRGSSATASAEQETKPEAVDIEPSDTTKEPPEES